MKLLRLLLNALATALGVLIAANTCEGISYGGDTSVLAVVALVLIALNLLIKPLLLLMTLPFIVLTLGIGLWVVNALLFMLVGYLVKDFHVASFWAALWGAFCVSVMNLLMGGKIRTPRRSAQHQAPTQQATRNDPNVIDI